MSRQQHDGQQPDTKRPDARHRLAGAGYAQLRYRFSLWCSGIEAHIDDFFVDGEARGRGVGSQLLAAAIARAQQRGARVVGLTTNERNAEALRLYQRAGFAADRPRWDGGRQLWLELEPQQVDTRTS